MTRSGSTPTEGASLAAGPPPRARQDEHRELDHRLANSLQLAADFLIFEHSRVADAHARAALVETAERLSAVGQMHRFLAAHHGAAGVDLDPFLGEFGRLIADTTALFCSVESDPIVVPAETAQQLAIAVNELAMNAAKLPPTPGAAAARSTSFAAAAAKTSSWWSPTTARGSAKTSTSAAPEASA